MRPRQEPIKDFNTWHKDGETYGFLIRIKIETEHIGKNYTLPSHPLGRIPIKIQLLDSDVPRRYPGVIFKDAEKIVLYFVDDPGTVLLRIE